MRLTFIGSSHGVPEPNRKCSCLLVEAQGQYYFVDIGSMANNDLVNMGIPVEAVKGIFITHPHGDHANGLIAYVDLCRWYYKTADPAIYIPDMRMKDIIIQWMDVVGASMRELRYYPVVPGSLYDDGVLKVTAIATQHCRYSHAFLLEADGQSVLVTGDLQHPSVDFPAIARERELNLIVCEAAHFSPLDYAPVLNECLCKRICVTHYVNRHISSVLALREQLEDREVFLAHDGLRIEV